MALLRVVREDRALFRARTPGVSGKALDRRAFGGPKTGRRGRARGPQRGRVQLLQLTSLAKGGLCTCFI
jgi:hypothetical protein